MNNKHDDKLKELFLGSAQSNSHFISMDRTMKLITETNKRKKKNNKRENIVMISYVTFVIVVSAALSFPGETIKTILQQGLPQLDLQVFNGLDLMIYYRLVIVLALLSICFFGTYFVKVSRSATTR